MKQAKLYQQVAAESPTPLSYFLSENSSSLPELFHKQTFTNLTTSSSSSSQFITPYFLAVEEEGKCSLTESDTSENFF